MTFTTTGLAHALTSLGLIFCGFWFFKAFQKIGGLRSGRPLGILLSVFSLGFAFNQGLFALGSLFFIRIPDAFYSILVVNAFTAAIIAALGIYLAFYVLLPKFSPWPATAATFIYGLFMTVLIFITHPQPFITASGGVNYGYTNLVGKLYYFLWLLAIGPPFLIFTKNFFSAVSRDVKAVSFIIMAATFVGLINVTVWFSSFFGAADGARLSIYDITLTIIGILLIVGFLVIPIVRGWISKRAKNITSQKPDVHE